MFIGFRKSATDELIKADPCCNARGDKATGKDVDKGEDPCWVGYEMAGTKTKGGKQVPNCIPSKK